MRKQARETLGLILRLTLAISLFGGTVDDVEARSLAAQLNGLYGGNGLFIADTRDSEFTNHDAHFNSDSLAQLSLLVQSLAPSAADFPALSTAPGITYVYDPAIQVFVPSSASLGSVFVERPETIGRGRFALGFSYAFIDFTELDGKDLDSLRFKLTHNDCCAPADDSEPFFPSPGDPSFEQDTADITFKDFSLESHVFSFFATYGITDRWDINFLLPIVFTSLEVDSVAILNNEMSGLTRPGGFHHFPDGIVGARDTIDDEKAGVGDVLFTHEIPSGAGRGGEPRCRPDLTPSHRR